MKNILFLMLAFGLTAGAADTGYLVCITMPGEKINCKNLLKIETVHEIVELRFPGLNINLEEELSVSRFFEIRTEGKELYIERKRITSRGKYRRITTRQWKKMKKL